MKFADCVAGRHGACEGAAIYEHTDDQVAYSDLIECQCWCHVRPIPDPEPDEVTFEP